MGTDQKSVYGSRTKKPCSTLTSDYFEHRIIKDNLDHLLADILQLKDPKASYDDLLGHVGLWLATWGSQGMCDDHLAAGRPPSDRTLARWLNHKWHHTKYQGAQDALSRAYGLRTQTEIRMRLEEPRRYIHPDALIVDPNAPVPVLRNEKDKDSPPNPTSAVDDLTGLHFVATEKTEPLTEHWNLATDILAVTKARVSDRYIRVAEYLFGGLSTTEVAALEGISEVRADKLYQRIRATIKYGAELSQTSLSVLRLINEEPFSTASEIADEVSDSRTALALLQRRGLIRKVKGSSYTATDAGRTAVQTGLI